jgi:hypothetical protein
LQRAERRDSNTEPIFAGFLRGDEAAIFFVESQAERAADQTACKVAPKRKS